MSTANTTDRTDRSRPRCQHCGAALNGLEVRRGTVDACARCLARRMPHDHRWHAWSVDARFDRCGLCGLTRYRGDRAPCRQRGITDRDALTEQQREAGTKQPDHEPEGGSGR